MIVHQQPVLHFNILSTDLKMNLYQGVSLFQYIQKKCLNQKHWYFVVHFTKLLLSEVGESGLAYSWCERLIDGQWTEEPVYVLYLWTNPN